jgi:hypothetical protein
MVYATYLWWFGGWFKYYCFTHIIPDCILIRCPTQKVSRQEAGMSDDQAAEIAAAWIIWVSENGVNRWTPPSYGQIMVGNWWWNIKFGLPNFQTHL